MSELAWKPSFREQAKGGVCEGRFHRGKKAPEEGEAQHCVGGALCQPTQSRGGRFFKPARFGILASFYCALFKKTAPPPTRCALPTIPCLATYAAPTRPDTKRGTERGHPEYPQRDVNASSFGCPSLQLGCSISGAWEARMQPSSRPFLRRAFRRRLRAAG